MVGKAYITQRFPCIYPLIMKVIICPLSYDMDRTLIGWVLRGVFWNGKGKNGRKGGVEAYLSGKGNKSYSSKT